MSPTETKVARSILAAYPGLATRSATEIAVACGASTASVTRFVARLEFPSFRAFHDAVLEELDAEAVAVAPLTVQHRDDLIASVIATATTNSASTLNRLTAEILSEVVATILRASEVAILGGRFSHALALYLHTNLQLMRPDVTLISQANVPDQIAHLGRSTCLIIFDFPRYQPDAERAARYIKSRRGRVVLVTDPNLSPASHDADFTLVADVAGPHRLVDSFAGPIALIDALVTDIVSSEPHQTQQRLNRVQAARDLFWTRRNNDNLNNN